MPACSPDYCGWIDKLPEDKSLMGLVWACDDDCGCSQAQVFAYETRPGLPGKFAVGDVWNGEFHIDFMGKPENELNRMAQHLRRHHHEVYARIRWPWTKG